MTSKPRPSRPDVASADFDRFFESDSSPEFAAGVKASIERDSVGAFVAGGATVTSFDVPLSTNAAVTVQLTDHGIPADAIILDVKCSQAGAEIALEWRTKVARHPRVLRGVLVLPHDRAGEARAPEAPASMKVTWIAGPK